MTSTDVRVTGSYSKPMRIVPNRGYYFDDRGQRVVLYLPPVRVK
jgi:hypothetical protein